MEKSKKLDCVQSNILISGDYRAIITILEMPAVKN